MLIYLRNAIMAGKRTPTAKDYVQNGLVAMWDGIENAGWGVHDGSATTWKDVVSGIILQKYSSSANPPTFDSKSAVFDGSNFFRGSVTQAIIDAWTNGQMTVEYVGSTSATASQQIFSFASGIRNEVWFTSAQENFSFGRDVWTNYLPITNLHSPRAGAMIWNGETLYHAIDGEMKSSTNPSPIDGFVTSSTKIDIGGNRAFNGSVFRVAIYSRALTANEIAANYAIDKARFGLT